VDRVKRRGVRRIHIQRCGMCWIDNWTGWPRSFPGRQNASKEANQLQSNRIDDANKLESNRTDEANQLSNEANERQSNRIDEANQLQSNRFNQQDQLTTKDNNELNQLQPNAGLGLGAGVVVGATVTGLPAEAAAISGSTLW
jgi:hypothetical protein